MPVSLERVADPPRASRAGGVADVLESERDVALDARVHRLQLGILEDEADLRGEHARRRW